jgi:hypothetical protein
MAIMPSDPATAQRLKLVLGDLVIHFGEFEVARQGAIIVIFHAVDERLSGKGIDKKRLLPDIFSEHSRYMRESVHFDGMGPFAGDIERIMDTADRLAAQRNHIVHGFIAGFEEATQMVLFRKFNVDKSKDLYRGTPLAMTIDELEAFRDEATTMSSEMTQLAARLMQDLFGDTESPVLDFGSDA